MSYFEFLDKEGGFFYERWGDAPVHSIAAGLMLKKEELHFFNDIAYYHVPFTHCPTGEEKRLELKCHCNPKDNFDWNGYSCKSRTVLDMSNRNASSNRANTNITWQAPTASMSLTAWLNQKATRRSSDFKVGAGGIFLGISLFFW